MKVKRQPIFVSGAFRSKYGFWGRLWNVIKAMRVCIRLARQGYSYFCPHLNYGIPQLFGNCQDDAFFLACCLKELPNSEIINLMKGWHKSLGALEEVSEAHKHRLRIWLEGEECPRDLEYRTGFVTLEENLPFTDIEPCKTVNCSLEPPIEVEYLPNQLQEMVENGK
jgi:hypothetical protein